MRQPAIALLTVLLLSGCVSLPGSGDAPRRFDLDAGSAIAWEAPKKKGSLYIEMPSVRGVLDTDYIAQRNGAEISYYKSRWSDRLPLLMHDYLLASLEGSGTVVGQSAIDIPVNWRLKTDIRRFETLVAADGTTSVEIELHFDLVRAIPVGLAGQTAVRLTVPAASKDVRDVTAAFAKASRQAAEELARWLPGAMAATTKN